MKTKFAIGILLILALVGLFFMFMPVEQKTLSNSSETNDFSVELPEENAVLLDNLSLKDSLTSTEIDANGTLMSDGSCIFIGKIKNNKDGNLTAKIDFFPKNIKHRVFNLVRGEKRVFENVIKDIYKPSDISISAYVFAPQSEERIKTIVKCVWKGGNSGNGLQETSSGTVKPTVIIPTPTETPINTDPKPTDTGNITPTQTPPAPIPEFPSIWMALIGIILIVAINSRIKHKK